MTFKDEAISSLETGFDFGAVFERAGNSAILEKDDYAETRKSLGDKAAKAGLTAMSGGFWDPNSPFNQVLEGVRDLGAGMVDVGATGIEFAGNMAGSQEVAQFGRDLRNMDQVTKAGITYGIVAAAGIMWSLKPKPKDPTIPVKWG